MSPAMDTLRTVLPVLLMLFLGAFCRRKAIISREGIQALKTAAVQIALPAVLLHTFAVTQYTFRDVMIPLIMFAVCVAAWLLGKALGPRLRMNSPFVPFLTTGFEAGMLGYALFTLLYGSEQVASFARMDHPGRLQGKLHAENKPRQRILRPHRRQDGHIDTFGSPLPLSYSHANWNFIAAYSETDEAVS